MTKDYFLAYHYLISGIVIIIFSLIIVYSITHYFTKSPIYSFWITIFPPIIFEQTSKISTEAVTISSILSAYYFVSKLKYYRASLVLSLSSIVRPISFFLFLAMICQLCRKYKIKVAFYCLIIYLSFPVFLIFFNYYHWGLGSLFIQIIAYNDFSRGTFGLKQLIVDIPRTIEWGQPKILFSGISYILFTLFILYKTIRVKTDFIFKNDNLLIKIWSISSIIFIFAIGPTPFLEELRRYLCIIFPLLLLIHFKIIFSRKLLFYSSFLFIIYTFIK